jgi:hypothetical protein
MQSQYHCGMVLRTEFIVSMCVALWCVCMVCVSASYIFLVVCVHSVCVCVHICAIVCARSVCDCVYTYLSACINVSMSVCKYVYMCKGTYVCEHVCMFVCFMYECELSVRKYL